MKNIVKIFLLLFIPLLSSSYTWQSFCPDTIHANNICFGVGSWKGVICSPNGMYLWEPDIEEWSFYSYGLPVTGAANLDESRILVTMGDGTYSDGIYTFHLETHQFEVVEWLYKPVFLKYYDYNQSYYVGQEENGLYVSSNGMDWSSVSYFDTINCQSIDFYGEHIIVSSGAYSFPCIYFSDDAGYSWNISNNGHFKRNVKFNNSGIAYSILPGMSNSAGIYYSNDYGYFWSVVYWAFYVNALGIDALGNIFLGWVNGMGIAILNNPYPYPYPELIFLNEGLPNLNINEITINPDMSAIAIFCCTDAGVYVSYDYMVGESENYVETEKITIFPNPVSNEMRIRLSLNEPINTTFKMEVYDNQGVKVDEIRFENNISQNLEIKWKAGNLPAGVYYLVVRTKNKTLTEKFIIL